MEKSHKKLECIISIILVLIIAAMWIPLFFEWKDYKRIISYIPLVMCTIFSQVFVKDRKRAIMVTIAMVFGLIADYFLILVYGDKTTAMCFFLCAQIAYAVLVATFAKNVKERIIQIVVRVALSVIGAVATFIVLKDKIEPLYVISVMYYVNMLYSAIISYLHFQDGKMQKLIAIGLTVFALCDIAVGFDFLISLFSLGPGNIIYELDRLCNFSVVFYIPSQVILSFASHQTAQ